MESDSSENYSTKEGENLNEDDIDIYDDLDEFPVAFQNRSTHNLDNSLKANHRSSHICLRRRDSVEDGLSLCEDFDNFEKKSVHVELQEKVGNLEQRCKYLEDQNKELKSLLDKTNKVNQMLKRNISSLFKTAKTELERKERQLKDLQHEHDMLVFRRIKQSTHKEQSNLSLSDGVVLKNENLNGNLLNIKNEDCTFRMGTVTISFMGENSDFLKERSQRLEAARGTSQPSIDLIKDRVYQSTSIKKQDDSCSEKNRVNKCDEMLEDGEVKEDELHGEPNVLAVVKSKKQSEIKLDGYDEKNKTSRTLNARSLGSPSDEQDRRRRHSSSRALRRHDVKSECSMASSKTIHRRRETREPYSRHRLHRR